MSVAGKDEFPGRIAGELRHRLRECVYALPRQAIGAIVGDKTQNSSVVTPIDRTEFSFEIHRFGWCLSAIREIVQLVLKMVPLPIAWHSVSILTRCKSACILGTEADHAGVGIRGGHPGPQE